MQLLKLASLAALAGFVAAAPAPQEDDPAPKPPFHIAFTFTNGSFTDPIDFPDTLDVIPTSKSTASMLLATSRDLTANVFRQT
jgi:hypothetical protein